MLRIVVILLAIPGCILGGIAGAVVGIDVELHGSLSEPNFDYMIRWGIGAGALGAGVTGLLLWAARREALWWVCPLGVGITLVSSCATMWWAVVSSLG